MFLGEEAKEENEEDIITSGYEHSRLSNLGMVKSYVSCHRGLINSTEKAHYQTEMSGMETRPTTIDFRCPKFDYMKIWPFPIEQPWDGEIIRFLPVGPEI